MLANLKQLPGPTFFTPTTFHHEPGMQPPHPPTPPMRLDTQFLWSAVLDPAVQGIAGPSTSLDKAGQSWVHSTSYPAFHWVTAILYASSLSALNALTWRPFMKGPSWFIAPRRSFYFQSFIQTRLGENPASLAREAMSKKWPWYEDFITSFLYVRWYIK